MAFRRNLNKNEEIDNQKPKIDSESAAIAGILSDDLYKDVAKIVGLDENVKEKLAAVKRKDYKQLYKGVKFLSKALKAVTVDKDTNNDECRTSESIKDTLIRENRIKKDDQYINYEKKAVREKVIWTSEYLPPETEKEKGLVKRAEEVTVKICQEFSDYMKSLGGYDSSLFDTDTLKELFQIEFDTHAARSYQIHIKPLHIITKQVAEHLNVPHLSFEKTLDSYIDNKIKGENRPPKRHAFGRTLPKEDRFSPINYETRKNWKSTNRIPKKTLTMEEVFGDITQLKCFQDYCKWIIKTPASHKPAYLKRSKLLDARFVEEISSRHRFNDQNEVKPLDVGEQIKRTERRVVPMPPENLKILPK